MRYPWKNQPRNTFSQPSISRLSSVLPVSRPPLESTLRAGCSIAGGRVNPGRVEQPQQEHLIGLPEPSRDIPPSRETRLRRSPIYLEPPAPPSLAPLVWKLSQVAIVSLRRVSGVTVAVAPRLLMYKVCSFIRLYVFMARACARGSARAER